MSARLHKFTDRLLLDPDSNNEDEIFCVLCTHFLIKPYEHNICSKLQCGNCFEKTGYGNRCPYCREIMSTNNTFYSKRAEQHILNLQVICCNKECETVYTIRDIDQHIDKVCEYEMRPCTDCRTLILGTASEKLKHSKECPLRIVKCENCIDSYVYNTETYHISICPGTVTSCKNEDCPVTAPRRDLYKHTLECGYQDIICPRNCGYKEWRMYYHTNHEHICGNRPIECDMCHMIVKAQNLVEHKTENCAERTTSCKKCKLNMLAKDMPIHVINKCPEQEIPCPTNCKTIVKLRDLDEHKLINCVNRLVECEECKQKVIHSSLPVHSAQTCPEITIICKCGESIKRKTFFDHLCKFDKVYCPYRKWSNCSVILLRKDIDEHINAKDSLAQHIKKAEQYIATLVEAKNEWIEKYENIKKKASADYGMYSKMFNGISSTGSVPVIYTPMNYSVFNKN